MTLSVNNCRNRDRIVWLDAAKGIAMLMVVFIHVAQSTNAMPDWFMMFAHLGPFGVQLFFILSGYASALSYDMRGGGAGGHFRRCIRLIPPYWGGILLYTVLMNMGLSYYGINFHNFNVVGCIMNFLLLNTFSPHSQNSIVPGGWSISCIAVFSLLAPTLNRFMAPKFWCRALLVSLGGIAFSSVLYCYFGLPAAFCQMLVTTQICCFIVGMCYFRVRVDALNFVRRFLVADIGLPVIAVFVLVISCFFISRAGLPFPVRALLRVLLVAFAFSMILPTIEHHENKIPRIMSVIGRYSYSIFIIHFVFAWTVWPNINVKLSLVWPLRFVTGYIFVLVASFSFILLFGYMVNVSNKFLAAIHVLISNHYSRTKQSCD